MFHCVSITVSSSAQVAVAVLQREPHALAGRKSRPYLDVLRRVLDHRDDDGLFGLRHVSVFEGQVDAREDVERGDALLSLANQAGPSAMRRLMTFVLVTSLPRITMRFTTTRSPSWIANVARARVWSSDSSSVYFTSA